jgi:DNA-binding SARP family transcriptional activator/tetratricopeptide (TPR) repeat protein
LRRDLHSDSVVLGAGELRLNSAHIGSDLADFNGAIACGDLERAVSAYAGPFLDGFFLSEAPEFERWIESERTRAATACARALETLAQRAAAVGDHLAAVACWRRLASADPLNDRVARQLMTAMLNAGDRVNALQYGESFRALLHEELGVQPDSALLDLIEWIRGEPEVSSPSKSRLSRAVSEMPSAALAAPPHADRSAKTSQRNSWRFLAPRELKGSRLKIAVVGGALGLTLGVASVALLQLRATPVTESRRVLVPAFENQTGDAQFDALGMMAADWILEALTRSQLVDAVDAATALAASRPTAGGAMRPTPLSAKELAEKTGATLMVVGTYRLRDGAIEIDAAISDVRNGKELRRISPVVVSQWSLQSGIATVRQQVLAELAPILNPGLRAWGSAAALPPSYEAYREYLLGLDLAWRDGEGAILHFRRATELDSNFVRPRLALVDMYVGGGDLPQADSVAAEADQRRDRLSRYDFYVLDFLEALIRGDHAAAYESSMLALETMPGSPLALRRAAYTAIDANHPQRAVTLLTRLDPGLGGCGDCDHYWWQLTSAEHMLGDYEQELVDAKRGIQQYPTLLPMRFNAIRALAALGREVEVERQVEAAAALPDAGWFNQISFMNGTVSELRAHGAEAAAQRVLRRALAWYGSVPVETKRSADYDIAYGSTLYLAHRWREAQAAMERGAHQHPGSAYFDGFVAVAALKAGDSKTVTRIVAELELPEAKYSHANKTWLSKLAALRGDRARAVALLREAFAEGLRYNVYIHAEPYLEPLHGYAPFEELMRPQG